MEQENYFLNYHNYPLVVGNANKITFDDWEKCGSTVQLQMRDAKGRTAETVEWIVESPEVAVVEKGLVRARTTGRTKVRALLSDGTEDVCEIVVIDNITRSTVQRIWINTEELELKAGESTCLVPFIYPEDVLGNGAMDRSVRWKSLSGEIVEVSQDGGIKALSEGEGVIEVISNDIGRHTTCIVRVRGRNNDNAEGTEAGTGNGFEGIDVKITQGKPFIKECSDGGRDSLEYKLTVGQSACLEAVWKNRPGRIAWCSSNPYRAFVDENGKVTASSSGIVEIYGTAIQGGKFHKIRFSIQERQRIPRKIFLNHSNLWIKKGEKAELYALGDPAASNIRYQWDVEQTEGNIPDNPVEIVECEKNAFGAEGIVLQGKNPGRARIVVSGAGQEASCMIYVSESPLSVKQILLEQNLIIQIEEIRKMNAELKRNMLCDSDSVNKDNLFWLSSSRECLTVDQNGILKAYRPGIVTIYCVAGHGLSEEEQRELEELARVRCLEREEHQKRKLDAILAKAVYGTSLVKVPEETKGENSLRFLHIPEETITGESMTLLWNRAALPACGGFDHYVICCKRQGCEAEKNKAVRTSTLGYTFRGLLPDTEYLFQVAAVGRAGNEMARREVSARTRASCKAVLDVTKPPFCAAGNGLVADTLAIQSAIDACPEGGTVLLPAGYLFFSGALFLHGNMTFQVDGILLGSTDPKDYPLIVSRWEGWRKWEQNAQEWENSSEKLRENHKVHASLLNAGVYEEGRSGKMGSYNLENLIICGSGMINGNGFKLAYNEGPNHHDKRGGMPVPFSTQSDPTRRGSTILLQNCRKVCVKDLMVCYAPGWTIHAIYCDQVTFDHVHVVSKGTGKTGAADDICILNGDGIDPDSSTNVNIFHCFFYTGDDAVAVKSGRNKEGNELNKPTAYLRVTDCSSVGSKGGFC
ncbi:MAG: Ig-like domain-containing protein, partial [Acetatifactor muris]|nr:Ig-like domain-containing protein [Acetatifactor muris]